MKLQGIVKNWGTKNTVAPGLLAALFTGIGRWRGNVTVPLENLNLSPSIRAAYNAQEAIGWEAALKGFLETEWRFAQSAYLESIQSKRSSLRVISALIHKLWDISWDMWE
jgi:hypothetical protein